jgi:hypothetical protein
MRIYVFFIPLHFAVSCCNRGAWLLSLVVLFGRTPCKQNSFLVWRGERTPPELLLQESEVTSLSITATRVGCYGVTLTPKLSSFISSWWQGQGECKAQTGLGNWSSLRHEHRRQSKQVQAVPCRHIASMLSILAPTDLHSSTTHFYYSPSPPLVCPARSSGPLGDGAPSTRRPRYHPLPSLHGPLFVPTPPWCQRLLDDYSRF